MKWEDIKRLSDLELAEWSTEIFFNQHKSQRQVAREMEIGKDTIGKLLRERGIVRDQEKRVYYLRKQNNEAEVSEEIQVNTPDKQIKGHREGLELKEGNYNPDGIEELLRAINDNISGMRNDIKQGYKRGKEKMEIEPPTAVISKEIRPLRLDEELQSTSNKMYPSVRERLDCYANESPYNKQQVFNMLLDEILKQQGY